MGETRSLNFTLLGVPIIPARARDIARLHKAGRLSRLLIGELVRSGSFRARLLETPPAERLAAFVSRYRRVFHIPPQKTATAVAAEFSRFLLQADDLIAWLTDRFVPESRRSRLMTLPRVRCQEDLVEQYLACFPTPHDGPRAHRFRFESRRRLLLALYLYEVAQGEGRDELLSHDRAAIESYLEERFLVPGSAEPADIRWIRDRERFYRVGRILSAGEEPSREERAELRTIDQYEPGLVWRTFRSGDREFPVLFITGSKRPFAHVLKMIAKDERAPDAIRDLRRVMLVFRRRHELLRGLQELRRRVWDVEGFVADQRWSIDGVVVGDPRSEATAAEYRHLSFIVPVFGSRYEVQILLLEDWLNSMSSDGPEHHTQYKAKQYFDRVFPVLFPQEIYQTNWQSKRLRTRAIEHICRANHIG